MIASDQTVVNNMVQCYIYWYIVNNGSLKSTFHIHDALIGKSTYHIDVYWNKANLGIYYQRIMNNAIISNIQ